MRLEQARKGSGLSRALMLVLAAIFLGNEKAAAAEWRLVEAHAIPAASAAVAHWSETFSGPREVAVQVVNFDPRACTLRVIDNPRGDDDLPGAMRAQHALAGVNGGYFHPDWSPLGLVISRGRIAHPLERAKLLSGLLISSGAQLRLLRVAEFSGSRGVQEALQAGPFLLDRGKAVAGLNATRVAGRTVLLADADGVRSLMITGPATLAELSDLLASARVAPGLRVQRALNLDGGSSSALWVRGAGEAFYSAESKTVRNYLAVLPRN